MVWLKYRLGGWVGIKSPSTKRSFQHSLTYQAVEVRGPYVHLVALHPSAPKYESKTR